MGSPVKAEVVESETEAEEVTLSEHEAALAQLGQERILNSQLILQNRQKELEANVMGLKTKYEEGGKFAMTEIDIVRGTIKRNRVP